MPATSAKSPQGKKPSEPLQPGQLFRYRPARPSIAADRPTGRIIKAENIVRVGEGFAVRQDPAERLIEFIEHNRSKPWLVKGVLMEVIGRGLIREDNAVRIMLRMFPEKSRVIGLGKAGKPAARGENFFGLQNVRRFLKYYRKAWNRKKKAGKPESFNPWPYEAESPISEPAILTEKRRRRDKFERREKGAAAAKRRTALAKTITVSRGARIARGRASVTGGALPPKQAGRAARGIGHGGFKRDRRLPAEVASEMREAMLGGIPSTGVQRKGLVAQAERPQIISGRRPPRTIKLKMGGGKISGPGEIIFGPFDVKQIAVEEGRLKEKGRIRIWNEKRVEIDTEAEERRWHNALKALEHKDAAKRAEYIGIAAHEFLVAASEAKKPQEVDDIRRRVLASSGIKEDEIKSFDATAEVLRMERKEIYEKHSKVARLKAEKVGLEVARRDLIDRKNELSRHVIDLEKNPRLTQRERDEQITHLLRGIAKAKEELADVIKEVAIFSEEIKKVEFELINLEFEGSRQ